MFTPVHTSLGALLLFQGSSGLLLHNGAVFGISSLLSGSVLRPSRDNVPIIAGLLSSVVPVYLFVPSLIPLYPPGPNSWASVASTLATGFLLGWGTKVCRAGCLCRRQANKGHKLEWSRMYIWPHALWYIPLVAALLHRNRYLLHNRSAHGKFGLGRPEHPSLSAWSSLLHSHVSVNSGAHIHDRDYHSHIHHQLVRGAADNG